MRIAAAARYAAVQRLIAAHTDEFRRLYGEEAEKRGVTVAPHLMTKKKKVDKLVEEIRASGVLDGITVPEKPLVPDVPDMPIIAFQRMTRADQLDAAAAGVPHRDATPAYIPVPPPPW